MGLGVFALLKFGTIDPVLSAVGAALFVFGASWLRAPRSWRVPVSAILAACGALFIPAIIADPGRFGPLLGLVAFVLIGTAVRVGLMPRGKA